MGFRDEIRLDDFIASSAELTEVLGHTTVGFSFEGQSVSFFPSVPPRLDEDYLIFDTPALYGSGASSRSTCTDVESWPTVVWDVNGYYHALGVGFRATKKQLMTAYRMRGGPDDARLTYYFQQLLNPQIRRLYDAAPLGSIFFDRYVEEDIRRRAHEMAAQLAQRGISVTPEDMLEQMGFVRVQDLPQEEGELDTAEASPENEDQALPPALEPADEPWPYTYYLWRVKAQDPRDRDIEHMSRWQDLIAQSCAEQGLKISFAVGLMGQHKNGSRIVTMSVDETTVVFIAQDAVDDMEELARSAMNRLKAEIN